MQRQLFLGAEHVLLLLGLADVARVVGLELGLQAGLVVGADVVAHQGVRVFLQIFGEFLFAKPEGQIRLSE